MHDSLSDSENAAASQDRGGLSGRRGRIAFRTAFHSRTPRAARSRGVRISAQTVSAIHAMVDRAFRQAPPATTRAAPARPAGLRIVET